MRWAGLALLLMLAAGCGDNPEDGEVRFVEVPIEDGRSVPCIVWETGYRAGLSCDWEAAQ